jgi:magnesium transporter
VLFLGEMLTTNAMSRFESEIQRAVVLAVFVPLIISGGGNAGSQASTLVIRALALGELHLADWWRVIRQELAAGLIMGGLLAILSIVRITGWEAFFPGTYGPHHWRVAFTVAGSVLGVVTWGTLAGSMLPFGLRRLGLDPASASAPFVATLVDVTGIVIYFTLAALLLSPVLR